MPDPAAAAIATKDIVGWSATGAGLIATYVWNFYNRAHTNRLGRELRRDAFKFDEWKAKRAALQSRLQDFEGAGTRISALTRGAHDVSGLRTEVAKLGLDLTMAHEALIRELKRTAPGWDALAFGRSQGSESDWDSINTVLADVAVDGDDPSALRTRLAAISPFIASIGELIVERIHAATAEHDPERI